MLEVFVNSIPVDITQELKISIDKIVSEYRNPSKKTGSYSYDFQLPLTSRNNRIFNNILDAQTVGKFTEHTYIMSVYVDDILVIEGEFDIVEVNPKPAYIKGNITTTAGGRLGDILPDKSIREISCFTELDFEGELTIAQLLDSVEEYTADTEIAFTYIPESFKEFTQAKPVYRYTDFGLSHFIAAITKNIFADLDYEVSGNIFDDAAFKKAILLYSNESGEVQQYNYAKLNPFTAGLFPDFFNTVIPATVVERYERSSDYVYVIQPQFKLDSGDTARCLGTDGVYTCKYTGLYNFTTVSNLEASTIGGSAVSIQYFTTFRRISGDNEVLDLNQIPDTSNFTTAGATSYNSDLDTLHIGTGAFSAKLRADEQYAIQIYVSVAKSINPTSYTIYHPNNNNNLHLVSCEGKLKINPADFLPNISQKDFLLSIFKLFNLYYTIDTVNKSISLFTRDEFFEQNRNNILSLDSVCDIESFKWTPISKAESANMFYRFAEDDNDTIHKRTDYLTAIGNKQYEDSEELPFSPLSFYKVKIKDADDAEYYVPRPGIIQNPATLDSSELETERSITFSYGPRIAFYLGTKLFKPEVIADSLGFYGYNRNPSLIFTFAQTTSSWGVFGPTYTYPAAESYMFFPTLSFITPAHQNCYEITTNTVRQEMIIGYTGANHVFEDNDQTFLRSATVLDDYLFSFAFTGNHSLFQKNYQSDIRIVKYSNYAEGTIQINSTLFKKLTGRNILQLDNDLYLLESIRGYQLGSNKAKLRIYRNMQ